MKQLLKRIIKRSPIPFSQNHLYDIQTRRIIKKHLAPDSNCIDVGSFEGEILDIMIRQAPGGKHFGIEPIPYYHGQLKARYKNRGNCQVFNVAASNEQNVRSFNYVTTNPSYSGLRKRDYDRPNEEDTSIEVQTELLDNLIPRSLKIDLIKIDVEGAELLVLEGATRIISEGKPLVIFEHGLGASNHYGTTPGQVFTYFQIKQMKISSLSNFLKHKGSYDREVFEQQYEKKLNYYFIAHP